ncbi:MAG TPA: LptF/LptG family permease [Ignavibacteriaceae bacterium]|nr:LptF/LptG family permease [Ignavibacteriaceae bacterium]
MKLKILDKYLIRQFLQTVVFGLLAFTFIFIVIDAMENLDDFIDQNVPALKILHYYFVFAPEMIKLMTPVAVLFSALFTAGKAANLSELTAIKASGVSLYRFMAPFIVSTFLITIISIYFGGYVVPSANQIKINIEQVYLKKNLNFTGSNIYFQDSRTRIVSIAYFDNSIDQANRVSIQNFNPENLTRMTSRIDASRLVYDTTKSIWVARDGIKRSFSTRQEADYFKVLEIPDLNFSPDDLLKKQQKTAEMNLDELSELVQAQQRAGNDPTPTLIEYHSRLAFAVTPLIVVLFGLPISANKRKGGLAAQVGINILVTFLYLVFMKVSQAFGKNGALDPILTAWVANLIFLVAAVYNVWRSRM